MSTLSKEQKTMKKAARQIVSKVYDELEKLQPTIEEIQEYADSHEETSGVITYSHSKGGDDYFLRYHDTWKKKFGGRVHIDMGYVDKDNCTMHLMLDQEFAPDFLNFIKKKREIKESCTPI